MSDLLIYRNKLNTYLAEYSHSVKKVSEEKQLLLEAKAHLEHTLEAQKLVQSVAESVQQIAHQQIAKTVSKCLYTIFREDACEFKINFIQRRGKTEAELVFIKDNNEIDPLTSSGGGMVDVASFALRLVCLILARPAKRKLIVMDEPCKFVNGEEYQSRVGQMLESLSKDFGIQMLIVTDDYWLRVGKVIEL